MNIEILLEPSRSELEKASLKVATAILLFETLCAVQEISEREINNESNSRYLKDLDTDYTAEAATLLKKKGYDPDTITNLDKSTTIKLGKLSDMYLAKALGPFVRQIGQCTPLYSMANDMADERRASGKDKRLKMLVDGEVIPDDYNAFVIVRNFAVNTRDNLPSITDIEFIDLLYKRVLRGHEALGNTRRNLQNKIYAEHISAINITDTASFGETFGGPTHILNYNEFSRREAQRLDKADKFKHEAMNYLNSIRLLGHDINPETNETTREIFELLSTAPTLLAEALLNTDSNLITNELLADLNSYVESLRLISSLSEEGLEIDDLISVVDALSEMVQEAQTIDQKESPILTPSRLKTDEKVTASQDDQALFDGIVHGKAKRIAKLFDLKLDEVRSQCNHLHQMGLDPLQIGLLFAAQHDKLEEILSISKQIDSIQQFRRPALELALNEILTSLDLVVTRSKISSIIGNDNTARVIERINVILCNDEKTTSSKTVESKTLEDPKGPKDADEEVDIDISKSILRFLDKIVDDTTDDDTENGQDPDTDSDLSNFNVARLTVGELAEYEADDRELPKNSVIKYLDRIK